MAEVTFNTPRMITALDYHDLEYVLELIKEIEPNKPLALFEDDLGQSEWFFDGRYHAILYSPEHDEKAVRKIYKTFRQ